MAPTNKRIKKPEAEEKRAKEEEETIDQNTDNDENDDLNLESQVICRSTWHRVFKSLDWLVFGYVRFCNMCQHYKTTSHIEYEVG